MDEIIEAAATAIDQVPNMFHRHNDWTSDSVPGLPNEVCRYDGDGDPLVVERFATFEEAEAGIRRLVSDARARAAIAAIMPVIGERFASDVSWCPDCPDDIRALASTMAAEVGKCP